MSSSKDDTGIATTVTEILWLVKNLWVTKHDGSREEGLHGLWRFGPCKKGHSVQQRTEKGKAEILSQKNPVNGNQVDKGLRS